MRNATNIRLDKAIIHILDPPRKIYEGTGRKPKCLEPSKRDIPLDRHPRIAEYFISHIKKSISNPGALAAQFIAFNADIPSGICKALLNEELDFIEGSTALATQLYSIIENDERINPCDLAICFYHDNDKPDSGKCLALLKLDPTTVFRHKTVEDEHGIAYVSFEIEEEVLPTKEMNLQKCAFIRSLEPRPEYDMILLDKEVKAKGMAEFFLKEFLGAKLAFDARERTKRLILGLTSAQNIMRPKLTSEQNEALNQSICNIVNMSSINVDNWIEQQNISDELKKQLHQSISPTNLPDREFPIDNDFSKKLTKKLRFKGDFDLVVEVSSNGIEEVIKSVIPKGGTDEHKYYEIIIHTKKWDKVIR